MRWLKMGQMAGFEKKPFYARNQMACEGVNRAKMLRKQQKCLLLSAFTCKSPSW
jgi:hypothetical protein